MKQIVSRSLARQSGGQPIVRYNVVVLTDSGRSLSLDKLGWRRVEQIVICNVVRTARQSRAEQIEQIESAVSRL
jgi:hypothetical protein